MLRLSLFYIMAALLAIPFPAVLEELRLTLERMFMDGVHPAVFLNVNFYSKNYFSTILR